RRPLGHSRRATRRPARPFVEALEDRTTPSAVPVADVGMSNVGMMVAAGSRLYFATSDGSLWRTDPTGHAVALHTTHPLLGPNYQKDVLVASNPFVYFFTDDGGGDYTLWRDDSRKDGQDELQSVQHLVAGPGIESFAPYGLAAVGQDLYFNAE